MQYKDIKDVRWLFENLENHRIRRMLDWKESIDLAKLLTGRSYRTEYQAIEALDNFYELGMSPQNPECNYDAPRDLRWHKVDEGLPVTWSHSPINQRIRNAGNILRQRFANVSRLCGITFQETANRNADIHITWANLDGAGGTLGVTYVPASGERMAACGPLCGDIVFDISENWTPAGYFETVSDHEIGHALGLDHSSSRADLMYRSMIGVRSWQPGDIQELLKRYPIKS